MQWILIGGILLMNSFPQLLLIGIGVCGNNNLSLVTLPVEYDASHRALAVREQKCLRSKNMKGPKML
jgi:Zn-dependent membrane protease YugP